MGDPLLGASFDFILIFLGLVLRLFITLVIDSQCVRQREQFSPNFLYCCSSLEDTLDIGVPRLRIQRLNEGQFRFQQAFLFDRFGEILRFQKACLQIKVWCVLFRAYKITQLAAKAPTVIAGRVNAAARR